MADEKPNFTLVGVYAAVLFAVFIIIIVFTGFNISEVKDAIKKYGDDAELEGAETAQILLMGVAFTTLIIFMAAVLYFMTQKKVEKALAIGVTVLFCVILFFVFITSVVTLAYVVNSPDYQGGTDDFTRLVVYSTVKMFISLLAIIGGIILVIYLYRKKDEKSPSLLSLGKK